MPNPEIEAAWVEEAVKRLDAYKEGRLETISFEDIFGNPSSAFNNILSPDIVTPAKAPYPYQKKLLKKPA